ncbi:MAG: hypothetical protein JXA77_10290 [Bacteroidales bacterium]|nr:hypothetical protein [Bacteroidales bacterium]MBN2818263.1 hypothetical protein [Bacteroidales bacterium]
MQQTNIVSLTSKLLVAFLLFLSFTACQSGKQKQDSEVSIEDFISDDDIFDDIDKAKKIFYSLPSPLETAMIIKSAGAEYDQELLNSLDNVEKYSSSRALALNLGIYTTDLSFASLFEQTQTSIDYMNAARSMAEGLNITDAIDKNTIDKLEQNLDNRDIVMDIISETFLNSSSYLKENERQDVAAIVLVGGWVEGLYIASELIGDNSIENNKLADRVLEQKLSFNIVQRLLDDNKEKANGESNQDIVDMIAQLEEIKAAFDKVKIETSKATVEENDESGVAQVSSTTKITVTPEDFKALQASINKLRTSFIQ